jgi:DNA replication and repair protein RecF
MQNPCLRLESLLIQNFRNVAQVELALSPQLTVLHGDNGQGKTNLIEAIYWLSSTKSFRTSVTKELLPIGTLPSNQAAQLFVRGAFTATANTMLESDTAPASPLSRYDQSAGLATNRRVLRIEGKAPTSLAAFALRSPVVVFSPSELSLSIGPSSERRRVLDRIGFFLDPSLLRAATLYQKALRSRQQALKTFPYAPDLATWEQLVATYGIELREKRKQAFLELEPLLASRFHRVIGLPLALRYETNTPVTIDAYREQLARDRPRDAKRGSASAGPHRDDLTAELSSRPFRMTASQGQHRAFVLALKAAEMQLIERSRGVVPLLLLDDVSSELDRTKTARLFQFLSEQKAQIVLTTTRPETIPDALHRRDYRVEAGHCTPTR